MTEARLTGSDKRALMLWIIFGIFGAIFAHRYFFQAFPEASIDFTVTQQDALKRATAFLNSLGENVEDYKSTVVFAQDDDAKTYLERELGLKQANQLMGSEEVSTWYWDARFFRPLQTEEYLVQVSPSGRVVAYNHKIEEAKGAKSLSREEALDATEQFLRGKIGTSLDKWNFLPEEASSTTRPNRIDWSFTWERKDFKVKDAPYRLEVGIQGDKIGSEQEFLKVPDEWARSYQKLRSLNNLYETIALIPYGFLLGGALWLGFTMWRRGQTTWVPAFKVGGFVAALYLLMQLNSWNTLNPTYNTQDAYSGFVAQRVFLAVLVSVASGLLVTIVVPGGEPLYRESQPDKLQLYKAFTLRGLRSKEFFCASVVGLTLAAAHIGFIVAFYIVGSKLGAWAPQDTNYSDAFNTAIPWIGGVAIGVTAATSEEFLFRLFAIPFLRKLTGSRVVAVILPAFFWGFLHSNYPQEPGYVRGIEVGLIGIVAGLVMLRWGIIATLIWHYTVDASLVGLLLIRSDNLYYRISGIAVGLAAVAPLAWSGISYLTRGRFEPVDDLLNSAAVPPSFDLSAQPGIEEATAARRYTPLTLGMVGFLALCVVIGPLIAWKLKRENVGDYLQLSVNTTGAKARADEVMRQHGLNPATFKTATELVNVMDAVNNEYLRRRMTIAQINEIYEKQVPGVLWRTRYFKDSDPEEFAIILKPDGSLHSFRHTLAEAAKGASLDRDTAVVIGERYLREEKQVDLADWKLVGDDAKKQPNRTDHLLTWQQNTPLDPPGPRNHPENNADHAYKRIELSILGQEPANYRTYIKIPEEFTIKLGQRSLLRTLFGFGKGIMYAVFALGVLVFYFKRSRGDLEFRVPWRKLVGWGLVGMVAYLAHMFVGVTLAKLFAAYPTATPWKIFLIGVFVGQGIFCVLLAGCLVLLYGLLWYFAARAFGKEAIPTLTGMPNEYYRDAFWLGLGGTAALIGVERLLAGASQLWPTTERMLPASVGLDFDGLFPGATVIVGAVLWSLLYVGAIAVAGSFLGAEIRNRGARLVLLLAVAVGFIGTWGSSLDFLKHFLENLLLLAFVVVGISRFVRLNLAGLFLIVTSAALLAGASPLLTQADKYYKTQGYLILVAVVVLLALPLVQWRLRASTSAGLAAAERP